MTMRPHPPGMQPPPSSALRGLLERLTPRQRQYALLGLLGIGCYNALLYLALKTSTPLNVTLVSSSMPVWMLAIGRLFWGIEIGRASCRERV